MKHGYVYLLTIYTRSGLEPFGAYSSEQTARQALHVMKTCEGAIITRLEMNCHYTNGIGEAKHWHVEKS